VKKSDNLVKGRLGETLAAEYLENLGWIVLARNVRTPYGELDIIAQKGQEVLVVEVKLRTTKEFGYPEAAITRTKAKHLMESAVYYFQANPQHGENWRIDVIAIEKRLNGQSEIVWFENAVSDIS